MLRLQMTLPDPASTGFPCEASRVMSFFIHVLLRSTSPDDRECGPFIRLVEASNLYKRNTKHIISSGCYPKNIKTFILFLPNIPKTITKYSSPVHRQTNVSISVEFNIIQSSNRRLRETHHKLQYVDSWEVVDSWFGYFMYMYLMDICTSFGHMLHEK